MERLFSSILGALVLLGLEVFIKRPFGWEWFLTLGKPGKQIEDR
jgi:hypothetical protein